MRPATSRLASLPLPPYYDQRGQLVELGEELGRGGEGAVFRVVGHTGRGPELVAKLYLCPPELAQTEKLRALVASSDPELSSISAWPQRTLEAGGQLLGFVMPLVDQREFHELHNLLAPLSRRQYFPQADWRFAVHVARNLARAFAVLHVRGHLMGDVNSRNILVSERGVVRLIDTDSFQVTLGERVFPCPVGTAECTPPELQGQSFGRLLRRTDHDTFGLALLIFQLLFQGRHPYAGIHDGGALLSPAEAIAARAFAYSGQARGVRPPPGTLSLRDLPPALAALFEQAFGSGGARPSAAQWEAALAQLQADLTPCARDPAHQYYQGLTSCPWCRLRPMIRRAASSPWRGGTQQLNAELNRLWQQVEAVPAPAPTAAGLLTAGAPLPPLALNLPQRPAARPLSPWRWLVRVLSAVGLISALWWLGERLSPAVSTGLLIGLAVTLRFGRGEVLEGWAGALLRGYSLLEDRLFPAEWRQREATRRFWDAWLRHQEELAAELSAQRVALNVLVQKYEHGSGELYRSRRAELSMQRDALLHLARNPEAAPAIVAYRQQQLQSYLASQSLRASPRLEPRLVAELARCGVRTALDITPDRLRHVPGLSGTRQRELLHWRAGLESFFPFDPRRVPPPVRTAAAEEQTRKLRRELAGFEANVQAFIQVAPQWQRQSVEQAQQIRAARRRIRQLEDAMAELRSIGDLPGSP